MKLYKVLDLNGASMHGGEATWFLPNGKPGGWMPSIEGDLVACENGYHLCRDSDLVHWLGPVIWEAEYRGEMVADDNKIVVREARLIRRLETWNDRAARLFACDCAEWALGLLYESERDPRSVEAIRVARAFALGEANQEQLAAARAATRDAAGAAARAAARDATRDAAWDAAWAAARAATRDAARAAARAAARDATWAAAGAATRDAAWDAAWAAALAAAWDAAWEWQTERLMWYLRGEEADGG